MKQKLFVLLRAILSFAGSLLLGHVIFHKNVDNAFIEAASGCILGITSVIWSIKEKCLTLEMVEGTVRQTITFVCGLAISSGIMKPDQATQIMILAVATLPIVQSALMRKKNENLSTEKSDVSELKANIPNKK